MERRRDFTRPLVALCLHRDAVSNAENDDLSCRGWDLEYAPYLGPQLLFRWFALLPTMDGNELP